MRGLLSTICKTRRPLMRHQRRKRNDLGYSCIPAVDNANIRCRGSPRRCGCRPLATPISVQASPFCREERAGLFCFCFKGPRFQLLPAFPMAKKRKKDEQSSDSDTSSSSSSSLSSSSYSSSSDSSRGRSSAPFVRTELLVTPACGRSTKRKKKLARKAPSSSSSSSSSSPARTKKSGKKSKESKKHVTGTTDVSARAR